MKQEIITINGVNITSNQSINDYWPVCLEEFLNTTPFPDIDHLYFTLDYFEEELCIINLAIFLKDTDHPFHQPLNYEDWESYKAALENNLELAFIDHELAIHTNASITTRHSETTILISLIF